MRFVRRNRPSIRNHAPSGKNNKTNELIDNETPKLIAKYAKSEEIGINRSYGPQSILYLLKIKNVNPPTTKAKNKAFHSNPSIRIKV